MENVGLCRRDVQKTLNHNTYERTNTADWEEEQYYLNKSRFIKSFFSVEYTELTLSPPNLKLSFGTTFILNIIPTFRKQIIE